MLATLAGSHALATLSAAAQSCWWQYMSMASLGLPALTNSSSASPNLPVLHGKVDPCQSIVNRIMSGQNTRQQHYKTLLVWWRSTVPLLACRSSISHRDDSRYSRECHWVWKSMCSEFSHRATRHGGKVDIDQPEGAVYAVFRDTGTWHLICCQHVSSERWMHTSATGNWSCHWQCVLLHCQHRQLPGCCWSSKQTSSCHATYCKICIFARKVFIIRLNQTRVYHWELRFQPM